MKLFVHAISANITLPATAESNITGLYLLNLKWLSYNALVGEPIQLSITYRSASVTRNTITICSKYAYVPHGYRSRMISFRVIFFSRMKYSMVNGSIGRISRKNPNMHSSSDTFTQLSNILFLIFPLLFLSSPNRGHFSELQLLRPFERNKLCQLTAEWRSLVEIMH